MRKMLPLARPMGKSGVYFLGLLLWEGLAHCGQCPCRDGGIGGGIDRGVGGAGRRISEPVLRKKERKGGMGTSSILFREFKEKTTWLHFK